MTTVATKPMVSIVCLTYNQRAYIEDCLESLLAQETSFSYEAIVHDDASTDGTGEVVLDYARRNPDKLIPVVEKENQWSKGTKITDEMVRLARGDYIALCEGDDYWTNNGKLEMQCSFMQRHQDYSLCLHNAVVLDLPVGVAFLSEPRGHSREKGLGQLVTEGGGLINPTASFFFRRRCYDFHRVRGPVGDHFLMLSLASRGKVWWVDEPMSAYRRGSAGSWTSGKRARTAEQINAFHDEYIAALEKFSFECGCDVSQSVEEAIEEIRDARESDLAVLLTNGSSVVDLLKSYGMTSRFFRRVYRQVVPQAIQRKRTHAAEERVHRKRGTLVSNRLDRLPPYALPCGSDVGISDCRGRPRGTT